ncbi:cytochrome P450 [Gyrodon lividus]|nr:cytochrome P450 [Gyrodon lividus]
MSSILSPDISLTLSVGAIIAALILFLKLAKSTQIGDIFKARMLNQNIIVINSEKVAKTLLDGRASVYSDRPFIATRVPYGWTFHFAWQPYGERWRLQRKVFNQFFRAEAALEYRPIQLQKARQLVLDLVNAPAAIIMAILYGYELSPGRDHFVELFERGAGIAFEGLSPESASIVATFPFVLRLPTWFPGASFSRRAALSKKCADEMVSAPFEFSRQHEADRIIPSSMVSKLLRSEKPTDDPSAIQLFKDVAASGFIGGAETSTSALQCFFLAMLQNPDSQKRAQAEIDEVVGVDRLPNFDDRPSLPYVEAFLRETMRLYPILPLSIAHATVSDDVFEGYFIPKGMVPTLHHFHLDQLKFTGSAVVPNVWAMLRNPDVYPDPNSFKPERYFKDGKLDAEPSTSNIGYGFGRRICPGRHVADASIWAAVVTMLSTLTISKALDDQDREIDVDPKFTCGVTSCPLPFPCKILPRRADFDAEKFSREMKDM